MTAFHKVLRPTMTKNRWTAPQYWRADTPLDRASNLARDTHREDLRRWLSRTGIL